MIILVGVGATAVVAGGAVAVRRTEVGRRAWGWVKRAYAYVTDMTKKLFNVSTELLGFAIRATATAMVLTAAIDLIVRGTGASILQSPGVKQVMHVLLYRRSLTASVG